MLLKIKRLGGATTLSIMTLNTKTAKRHRMFMQSVSAGSVKPSVVMLGVVLLIVTAMFRCIDVFNVLGQIL